MEHTAHFRNRIIIGALFITALLATLTLHAQDKHVGAFVQGSKTLGFSIGFGVDYGYRVHGERYTSFPAFAVSYDQGIVGNVGPGTIGLGGIFGIKSAFYEKDGFRYTWNNYIIGVRPTYHLTILSDKNSKFDPYAGVLLGVRSLRYRDDENGPDPYRDRTYAAVGAFIGAKYNFTRGFGLFTEFGYDISLLRFGLNFNF